jgi:hypothetical protein
MGRGDGGSNEAPPDLIPRLAADGRPNLEPLPTARELMMELLPLIEWAKLQAVFALQASEAKRAERERAALYVLTDLGKRLRELTITW